jgi:DHA2 family methylenomycin A resistance protein-like MFS transporter
VSPVAKAALFLAMFMGVFDAGAVYLALPPIEADLRTGIADEQWIVGIYLLMQASLTLPTGTLGDLLGRRTVFLTGVILFTLGSVGCGLAHSAADIIGARFVQGIGGAVINALALAMAVGGITDADERERTVRQFTNVCGVAAVIAPALGGVLVHLFGWRVLFFVNVPVAIFVVGATLRTIAPAARDRTRTMDRFGYFTSFSTLLCLSFALIEGETFGWLSPVIVGAFVLAIVSLAVFIRTEEKRTDPMLKLSYFRDRVFCGANYAVITNGMQYFGAYFLAALFLQNVLGLSPLLASAYLTPSMLAFFIVNQFGGAVDKKIGLARSAMWGTVVCSVALMGYWLLTQTSPAILIALILVCWAVGAASQYTPAATVAMGEVPGRDAGMGSGVIGLSLMFGGILGVGLGGSVLSAGIAHALRTLGAPAWLIASSHHGGTWSAIAAAPIDAASKSQLTQVANQAYVQGMHASVTVLIALGLIAALAMAFDFQRKPAPQEA